MRKTCPSHTVKPVYFLALSTTPQGLVILHVSCDIEHFIPPTRIPVVNVISICPSQRTEMVRTFSKTTQSLKNLGSTPIIHQLEVQVTDGCLIEINLRVIPTCVRCWTATYCITLAIVCDINSFTKIQMGFNCFKRWKRGVRLTYLYKGV